jgi:hypothetical protein
MPIEIKELHIKAIVGDGKKQSHNTSLKPEEILKLKRDIAKDVIDKVFKTLQQRNER